MGPWRILIVEDYAPSRTSLGELLRETIPSATVEEAADRKQARRMVDAARNENLPYDVAVVDLLLPADLSGSPEEYEAKFDTSFFAEFWRGRYQTPVVLMTAFENHEGVGEYFAALDVLSDGHYRKHTKRTGFTHAILNDCRDLLYGESLLQRLRGLFHAEGELRSRPAGRKLYDDLTRADRTALFSELRSDIANYWRFLQKGYKTEIGQYVRVIPSAGSNASVSVTIPLLATNEIAAFRDRCGKPKELGRFRIYSMERDPNHSIGAGRSGVCPPSLITGYEEGLQRCDKHLSTARERPDRLPIEVFVMDLSKLHLRWDNSKNMLIGCPFSLIPEGQIFLPSRSVEPSASLAKERASVEAAHEVAHFFNTPDADPEHWWPIFNEATCFFVERALFPANPWTITASIDWLDNPSVSWREMAGNGAWVLLQFLESRWPGNIDRAWREHHNGEEWLAAMRRLYGRSMRDLFADFFPIAFFAENLCPGFGDLYTPARAIRMDVTLGSGRDLAKDQYALQGLSCAYYRIRTPENGSLRIEVAEATKDSQFGEGIQARVVASDADSKPGNTSDFSRVSDLPVLTLQINCDSKTGDEHWILCISNLLESTTPMVIPYMVSIAWSE
jgi:CheY-like chemotaxis protein